MPHAPLDAWQVAASTFPHDGTITEKMTFLLRYAVLAPSGHNSQPWVFRIRGEQIDLLADRRRALPVVDPEDRELTISCGAALFNLRIAARHFGYSTTIARLPEGGQSDWLARVICSPGPAATAQEDRLFEAIPKRRTSRHRFDDRTISPDIRQALGAAVDAEGACLGWVPDAYRDRVADLVVEGDRLQARDKRFRRELAAWLHPNRTRSRDGMPGYGFGLSDLASYMGPFVMRTFDWGKGQAAKDRQLAEGSPGLAVLGTSEDTPAAWLRAGEALEHMLLLATHHGLCASYLNQPVEVDELRPHLAEVVEPVGHPQLLLRLGYGPEVPHSPRRTAEQVVVPPEH